MMANTETTPLAVYLIDDDPDHTLIISRAIGQVSPDVQVQTVDDGQAALNWLRQAEQPPDLILLDINMVGLSGFDVLAQLKADPALRFIPVVMLTSSEAATDVARAYELGASGYISKPSYLHDVRAVVGNTLLYWAAMKRAAPAKGRTATA